MAKREVAQEDIAHVFSQREGDIVTPHGVLSRNGVITMPREEAEAFVARYPETQIIK
jgi:hypothetical protein